MTDHHKQIARALTCGISLQQQLTEARALLFDLNEERRAVVAATGSIHDLGFVVGPGLTKEAWLPIQDRGIARAEARIAALLEQLSWR